MICPNCRTEILDDSHYCSKCGAAIHSSGDTATHTIVRPAEELPPGTLVAGKYRILDVAGRGGMGVVYRAEDTKLKRHVALKFLPPALVNNVESRQRFVMEARAAAALSHAHICTIHEIHDEEAKPFIEMEFVEGENLRARVRKGALPASEAIEIAMQIASGLDAAHRKGIIHRDIKSTNIMITPEGQAKIMDFGLAKVKGETLYTRDGTTLGTVAYMAPEQAAGGEVDQRADVWSLGVVLYEMLSGQLPFSGDRDASVLYAVVHEPARPIADVAPGVPPDIQRVIERALKKNPADRYGSAEAMLADMRKYRDRIKADELRAPAQRTRWRKLAVPVAAGLLAVAAVAGWLGYRQSRIHWARETALPEIAQLLASVEPGWANLQKAHALAEKAARYIPGDARLRALQDRCAVTIDITTDPPGAEVYLAQASGKEEWRHVGTSPMRQTRLPAGTFRWRMEKSGCQTVYAAAPTFRLDLTQPSLIAPYNIHRILDAAGGIPAGTVRVVATETQAGKLPPFLIDKYEVTNRRYKEFLNAGGYRDRKYWKHEFVKDGRKLTWEQAMAEFVDQTGRSGPATWSEGDYPKGQEDYPVSGVAWYEAAAYAEFSGRNLPTTYHWGAAIGAYTPLVTPFFGTGWLYQASNFKGEGPAAVGSNPGMSAYGAYDMAGNVREWCWNETGSGRTVRGGAWNDVSYMTLNISQAPAFDRSPKNGFRCASYADAVQIPAQALAALAPQPIPDYYQRKPVPEAVYQVYRDQFLYDKRPLNTKLESRDERSPDWVLEKVTVNAAYGNERLPLHLFIPKNASPPYQAVVYVPGSGSTHQASSKNLGEYREFNMFLSFVVKSGRVGVYPVYKATFERSDPALTRIHSGAETRQYSELVVQIVKDFRTAIDYLETRPDLDRSRFAYLGMSWGGVLSPIILAVEGRIKASVLVVGGLRSRCRPEVDPAVYVPHVKAPTLMLNGKYDFTFPFETSAKPMFDLLGTPPEHKRQRVYESDHYVPRNEAVKETLAWLDRYLGPVK
ncbi:MAG: protein kinase [Bryobacteraceae bacterium]